MNPIVGLLLSYVFIFLGIIVGGILLKFNVLSNESSRKFIHIYVGNWWIAAMIMFDSAWIASIGPISFVVINYISYKKQLFKGMERGNQSSNDLGTVYYALSLVILTVITFWDKQYAYIGAIGILIMAYGDGLAAVIGKKYGKRIYQIGNVHKSLEGSMTMFLASCCVSVILIMIFTTLSIPAVFGISIIISTGATLLEAYTPYGYDNLTVPLGASLLSFILIYYV